ncbi:GNAT family N-acetyltransferase [Streptomyces sp. YIM 130001]|uniref:GNAT family N-acetyltransferase n=1 Tax=Streptomyces sp. YIM 130001 TaxID=2259644 RepID=UPI001F09AF67|nr:GNAT family N-acetyltransferase [Streptomyces sp. YIM 130001]
MAPRTRTCGPTWRRAACTASPRSGRIIGFSVLDGAAVDLMMVAPEHHRRGAGRGLLRQAPETLLARCPTVRLVTFPGNTRATEFYEACGWVLGDRLDGEGPADVEYTRTAGRRTA